MARSMSRLSVPDALEIFLSLQGVNDAEGVANCAAAPAHGAAYGNVKLPNLNVEVQHRSQRPRLSTDVTVITQCSVDRRAGSIDGGSMGRSQFRL